MLVPGHQNSSHWACDDVGVDDDNVTLVVRMPDSPCVIESLTSHSVQHTTRSWGWKVKKQSILYPEEVPTFSEILAAGAAIGLIPIRSMTRWSTKG
jgi:branched-chain amino acid aminotransferase